MSDERPGPTDPDGPDGKAGEARRREGDEDQLLRETKLGFALLVLLIVVFVAGMWLLSSIIYGEGSPRGPEGTGSEDGARAWAAGIALVVSTPS